MPFVDARYAFEQALQLQEGFNDGLHSMPATKAAERTRTRLEHDDFAVLMEGVVVNDMIVLEDFLLQCTRGTVEGGLRHEKYSKDLVGISAFSAC